MTRHIASSDKVLEGAEKYAVPGVNTRTLSEAIDFGSQVGADFVRWNQSSGPLADLVKAGLEKLGVQSALSRAVGGDLALLAPGAQVSAHSAGTAVVTNALQNSPNISPGLQVTLNASIVGQGSIAAAALRSGSNIMNHSHILDAVTYLGRNPLAAPVGAALTPLIPYYHFCSTACLKMQ